MLLLNRAHRRRVARQVDGQGLDVGLRSDGRRLLLPYPVLAHLMVTGLTGSGKSGFLNALLHALAPLPNVALLGVDMKQVEFTPWGPRFTWMITDPNQADRLFTSLRVEVERREAFLQSIGRRHWDGSYGPWIVLMIDEFAELAVPDLNRLIEAINAPASDANDKRINQLKRAMGNQVGLRSAILESFARKCRALGVVMVVATQYPTADVIDTQVRSQFGIRVMCRVTSKEQIKVCLGNGMEEHVDVTDLSPDQPGSFVVTGLERKIITARASLIDDDTVTATVAATAHLRVPDHHVFPTTTATDIGLVPVPLEAVR